MCGIFGYFGSPLPPTEVLRARLDSLRHRGPDRGGVWRQGDLYLGHQRLAIIDLDSRADQPMLDPEGRVALVFNGEVYNYRELRRELDGYPFRTDSDTEVILAAYLRWGSDFASRLWGMFAIAIYDDRGGTLTLVRDRIGKKPLYLYHSATLVAFASEVRALNGMDSVPLTLDPVAVNSYFASGCVGGERSIYRGISKVAPGEIVRLQLRDPALPLERHRYWTLPLSGGEGATEAELVDELDELLRSAVALRLRSDVPLGVLLSGGVDSSLLAALAAQGTAERLRTFTIAFRGSPVDESAHARRIAAWLGTEHVELDASAPGPEQMGEALAGLDEPFADSSLLPMHLVSRLAREHVTVALSGDGGDELFAGYGHYDHFAREHRVRAAWPAPARRLAAAVAEWMPERQRVRSVRRLAYDDSAAGMAAYYSNFFTLPQRARLLRGGPVAADGRPEEEIRARFRDGLDWVQNVCQADFQGYMVDDILVKVDRMSMLNSLEIRSPLLDHRVAELVFGRVPPELKRRAGEKKYLLKQVARRYLPEGFDFARKHGFGVPLEPWFRAWAGDQLERHLREEPSGVFDPAVGLRLLAAHRRGFANHAKQLFALLVWEDWFARARPQAGDGCASSS